MSLRDFVSGAGCSADGASGSGANPAASFADALLGSGSKTHEGQLRQLPGVCPQSRLTVHTWRKAPHGTRLDADRRKPSQPTTAQA